MKTRVRVAGVVGMALLLASCASGPERPVRNVNPGRHPHLAAAQDACQRAFDHITQAQQANEWDMEGHAQKAKDLLAQASEEIKQAALASNRHR